LISHAIVGEILLVVPSLFLDEITVEQLADYQKVFERCTGQRSRGGFILDRFNRD
jgi:hypothetical protein